MENSDRDGNTRPPDLPLEKPICRQEATALEAAQGAPRDPRRDSRGERSPWLVSLISRVTIYNLDILLSQFGTSLLFHNEVVKYSGISVLLTIA